jgi:hypothetical protein
VCLPSTAARQPILRLLPDFLGFARPKSGHFFSSFAPTWAPSGCPQFTLAGRVGSTMMKILRHLFSPTHNQGETLNE